ncbi:MAG: hypothetical protein IJK89_11580 [Clostridia bacterium]|nr:hypothetical protein [Clostridia bacterium]
MKRKATTPFRIISILLSGAMLLAVPAPCAAAEGGFACEIAEDWNALFDRRGRAVRSWLGADGIYTVKTAEDRTVFLFSDTLIGRSDANGKPGGAAMANHSAALLRGGSPLPQNLAFYYGGQGKRRDAANLFGERYWLFDAVYLDGTLHILAFTPGDNWKPLSVRNVRVPVRNGQPDFSRCVVDEPAPQLCRWTADGAYCYAFGQGITDNSANDGYVYLYGYKDPLTSFESRDLIVSRIRREDYGDFTQLRYWDGTGWCDEIERCADIAENVSCEMSCTEIPSGAHKGRFLLVYMHACNSGRLMYALGDSPVGPFDEPVCFYTAPEKDAPAANGKDTLYTYNAKAHPALSQGETWLISYNVNSSGEQYTTDYHPRFLYLILPGDFPSQTKNTPLLYSHLKAWLQGLTTMLLRFSAKH